MLGRRELGAQTDLFASGIDDIWPLIPRDLALHVVVTVERSHPLAGVDYRCSWHELMERFPNEAACLEDLPALSNFGQMRRNADRQSAHRLGRIALAIVPIIPHVATGI